MIFLSITYVLSRLTKLSTEKNCIQESHYKKRRCYRLLTLISVDIRCCVAVFLNTVTVDLPRNENDGFNGIIIA